MTIKGVRHLSNYLLLLTCGQKLTNTKGEKMAVTTKDDLMKLLIALNDKRLENKINRVDYSIELAQLIETAKMLNIDLFNSKAK